MSNTLKCNREDLFKWLDKHLDDCPCDWYEDDSTDNVTIIFEVN